MLHAVPCSGSWVTSASTLRCFKEVLFALSCTTTLFLCSLWLPGERKALLQKQELPKRLPHTYSYVTILYLWRFRLSEWDDNGDFKSTYSFVCWNVLSESRSAVEVRENNFSASKSQRFVAAVLFFSDSLGMKISSTWRPGQLRRGRKSAFGWDLDLWAQNALLSGAAGAVVQVWFAMEATSPFVLLVVNECQNRRNPLLIWNPRNLPIFAGCWGWISLIPISAFQGFVSSNACLYGPSARGCRGTAPGEALRRAHQVLRTPLHLCSLWARVVRAATELFGAAVWDPTMQSWCKAAPSHCVFVRRLAAGLCVWEGRRVLVCGAGGSGRIYLQCKHVG